MTNFCVHKMKNKMKNKDEVPKMISKSALSVICSSRINPAAAL